MTAAAPDSAPGDRREWVSFADPDEQRTWMFDATFLASNYMCIYGRGCKGIDEQPVADSWRGCCSHGAYFSDDEDMEVVAAAVDDLLDATNWQLHDDYVADPFVQVDDSWKTATFDGACVFQNRPDFAGGAGCALHGAALAQGIEPASVKPEVCWQVPVRREDHETETGHLYTMVREWARRDWGDGGDEFGWWCTEDAAAHVGDAPAWVTLEDELTRMCGEKVYELLAQEMTARSDATRSGVVWLPHPAVRSR